MSEENQQQNTQEEQTTTEEQTSKETTTEEKPGTEMANAVLTGNRRQNTSRRKGNKKPAQSKAASAAAAAKKAQEAKGQKRSSPSQKSLGMSIDGNDKLKVPANYRSANPKREGTKAHERFAMVQKHHGKSFAQFAKAWAEAKESGKSFTEGATPKSEILWCIQRGYLSIPGKEMNQ